MFNLGRSCRKQPALSFVCSIYGKIGILVTPHAGVWIETSLTNQNTEKMTRQEIEDRKNALASVILDREAKLKEHDYVSAKIADGRATSEEYAEVISQKNIWAKEVNDAQDEIAHLNSIIPEDDDMLLMGDSLINAI